MSLVRFTTLAIVAVPLALGACAKKGLPDNAQALGLEGTQGGLADLNRAGGADGNVPAGSKKDFTVNVGDRVFFSNNSSQLTGQARATLAKQAQWLVRYPSYPITIEGHADERGTREYNLALGARRAAATRDYLASQGVARSRLRTISFGKERPVAVCNDISCFSQNRRAVTLLSGPSS